MAGAASGPNNVASSGPSRGETRRINTVHSRFLHPALWPRAGLPTGQVQTQPEGQGPRGRDPDCPAPPGGGQGTGGVRVAVRHHAPILCCPPILLLSFTWDNILAPTPRHPPRHWEWGAETPAFLHHELPTLYLASGSTSGWGSLYGRGKAN